MTIAERPDTTTDLMSYVRDTAAEARANHHNSRAAVTKLETAEFLPAVEKLLEDAGLDIFSSEPEVGVDMSDPDVGWIFTGHGLTFRAVKDDRGRRRCWVLHPETNEPVCKIGDMTRWVHVALAIDEHGKARPVEHYEPSPADQLADALREFVRAVTREPDYGF